MACSDNLTRVVLEYAATGFEVTMTQLQPLRIAVDGQAGPLADAVREFLLLGRHSGRCISNAGICSKHEAAFLARKEKLLSLVAPVKLRNGIGTADYVALGKHLAAGLPFASFVPGVKK